MGFNSGFKGLTSPAGRWY